MTKSVAIRQSCFAFVSAIETDLRSQVCAFRPCPAVTEAMPPDVLCAAKERYEKYFGESLSKVDEEINLADIIDFTDFLDIAKCLNRLKGRQTDLGGEEIAFITVMLERLTPIRNRVCHSRPLEPNDFQELLDAAYSLRKLGRQEMWSEIGRTLQNINNPEYVFSLDIPSYWGDERPRTFHNLPIPEFDDTGFLGRKKDRENINKLVFSNTKVISIIGEGGIGKTALAQRCLFDALDACESSSGGKAFDVIIWVSLKANRLTAAGVKQIKDSIGSSLELYRSISGSLGDLFASSKSESDALLEIKEYMTNFRVLLCIDNLETISSQEVRDFLSDIPDGSKVIVTSRVGLGEIEYRYKLDRMEDKDSIDLIRKLSSILNLNDLSKKNNASLQGICRVLFNNPLLIKWYVFSLISGKSSGEILNRSGGSFAEAIKFCFENLYDRLSGNEIDVIRTIACARKPVTAVELRYFLDEKREVEIQEALHTLYNSSMLRSTDAGERSGRSYSLTDVAEEYLNSFRPIDKSFYEVIQSKKRQLQAILEQEMVKNAHYSLDVSSIDAESRDEKICASFLSKAISAYRKKDYEEASALVIQAKNLMPEYSECYRVNAYILSGTYPVQAASEYERAIEFNPGSVKARYGYAQFLNAENDLDGALEQVEAALVMQSDELGLKTLKARILALLGRYPEAEVLYEELMEKQVSNSRRKFRISTFDQASDCQRRMAEQYINDSDFDKALVCIKRSLDIISTLCVKGDVDAALGNRLQKIMRQAVTFYSRSRSLSAFQYFCEFIEENLRRLPDVAVQDIKGALSETCKVAQGGVVDLAVGLVQKIGTLGVGEAKEKVMGRVARVVDAGRGVSYGFIEDINGREFFFHRSELLPQDYLDGLDDIHVNLTFTISDDPRGPCAVNVRPVLE